MGPTANVLSSTQDATRRHARGEPWAGETWSQEWFESLVESSSEILAVVDRDGVVRYANPAHEQVYGISARELIGTSVFRLVAPEEVPEVRRLLVEALAATRKSVSGVVHTNGEIGRSRALEFTATNHIDDRAVQGFVINAKDVTEQLQHVEQLKALLNATIATIADIVECRDPYTAGHERRVARLSVAIAQRLGMSPDEAEGIGVAASIHDVGKIAIPAEILACPRPLTSNERALVQVHAQVGHDIVAKVPFPWPVAEMIVQHHERLDGSGYPNGLRGDEICRGARIIAVADTVEAVASHRPYRQGLGLDRALEILQEGRGTRFEPAVVDACVELTRAEDFRLDD